MYLINMNQKGAATAGCAWPSRHRADTTWPSVHTVTLKQDSMAAWEKNVSWSDWIQRRRRDLTTVWIFGPINKNKTKSTDHMQGQKGVLANLWMKQAFLGKLLTRYSRYQVLSEFTNEGTGNSDDTNSGTTTWESGQRHWMTVKCKM